MTSAPLQALAAGLKIQRGVAGLSSLAASSAAGTVAMSGLMNRISGYKKRMQNARQARIMANRAKRSYIPRTGLYIRGIHRFKRSAMVTSSFIPSTGLNGVGYGASIAVSLNAVFGFLGSGSFTQSFPNLTDFTNLFDLWRVDRVVIKVFFQNNSSTTASVTTSMPLVMYTLDSNDITTPTQNNMLEDQHTKYYQFGNGASKNGCLQFGFTPRAHLATGDSAGTSGTTGSRPEKPREWVDTSSSSTLHYGAKLYFDPMGGSQATTEGQVTFIVDSYFAFKDAN